METQPTTLDSRYVRETPIYLRPNLKQVMAEVMARYATLHVPQDEQPLLEVHYVNAEQDGI